MNENAVSMRGLLNKKMESGTEPQIPIHMIAFI
jgi:hypothetical protein